MSAQNRRKEGLLYRSNDGSETDARAVQLELL
jgi:hypothetical protein